MKKLGSKTLVCFSVRATGFQCSMTYDNANAPLCMKILVDLFILHRFDSHKIASALHR